MKILVYNNDKNKMETYNRNLNDPMPYSQDKYLSVKEFRGSSKSDTLWTDKKTIEAFNRLRNSFGKPIKVGYGFKRIGEGGHTGQSQHYVGKALDIGQSMTNADRDRLRTLASKISAYTYIEPKYLTPTWVHIDTRDKDSACLTGGYPLLKLGKKGPYVATLQDALTLAGYTTYGIDGIFGNNTRNAVIRFQRENNLTQDGIVGCNTWKSLISKVRK